MIMHLNINIFRMLGVESTNSYGSTVSRDDLSKIYKFFVTLHGDVFENIGVSDG